MEETDIVVVGAGPYALSLAANLRARGADFRIFGRSMKFWRDMPVGMNLKSLAFASGIYVPEPGHSFPEWCRQRNLEDFEPCTMQTFAEYGVWMQERFVPDLDQREVSNIAADGSGFEVTLSSGHRIRSRKVVCATGLAHLAHIPDVLKTLPPQMCSHTSSHTDFACFKDKDVAVVGAGASAIETGAFVQDAGGRARFIIRGGEPVFLGRSKRIRPLLERIKEPNTVLGSGMKHFVLQNLPLAVHFLPETKRIRLAQKYLPPSSPWWIKNRVVGRVPSDIRTRVVAANVAGERVRLSLLSDNQSRSEIEVDHVIAGTGYDLVVGKLAYLDLTLRSQLRTTAGAPALSMNFEASHKGLYFIGPMSAMSFGPLFRFVSGADFSARMLARHLMAPWARMRASRAPSVDALRIRRA